MSTMKAWQYSSTLGGLEKNLVLKEDVPVPQLSPRLGDSEVLVEIISASINPADYKVPELGLVARAMIRTPATPGMDFCGRVVKTGRTVDSFAIGEKVFGRIEGTQHGTLGQYIVAPATCCATLPDGVDPDHAAAIGTAGLTTYHCLATANLKPGDKVFINGGSGGTGTFGIQLAKRVFGCHVTVSCSGAKADLCTELGADSIIDYTAVESVSQQLKEAGQVYALVIDNVGSPADLYKAADDFLVPEGKFLQVGGDMSLGAMKSLSSRMLLPSFLGGGKRKFEFVVVKQTKQEDLVSLGQLMAEGKIKAVIDEVFEFGEVPKAFEKLKKGRSAGKIVVHVAKVDR
ncbi:chaperonin 10-like protein [Diplogelasinospora grovesii]|uniref:Chaperonin 10-like protein n=1 Tax=Diplogelasinospora grovesii TaxID=303347 RepID=A0AAN6MUW4_9PEZI|nr:chaperonin 10-like protein [Diplogelasinospora grovesii]